MANDDKASLAGKTTYWKGDLAVYTGKTEMLHGGLFYEIELAEGHLKGEKKVTSKGPDPEASGTRYHVARHALGQNVQGALGRGGVEYEVFDSGEKPSRLVFVSRNEEEAIAEARRLNDGGEPGPWPEWIQSAVSRPSVDHSILSPSGRASGRSRDAAIERTRRELFTDAAGNPMDISPKAARESEAERYLRQASEFRALAARGMSVRKYAKEADRLEAAADRLDGAPPGKARCSICGKVGSKANLAKHEAKCTERDIAARMADERELDR